jgi:hypothetical protein
MKIAEYLREEVFGPRLKEGRVLVLHDPDKRYREIVEGMASEEVAVVYGDESTILPRQEAQNVLLKLGRTKNDPKNLLVYLTRKAPVSDEDRQIEPFAAIAAAGRIFPEGDGDGYQALCRKAKPEHVVEVDRLFEQEEPSFEHLDALDEGESGGWPRLSILTGGKSPQDILFRFLTVEDREKWDEKDDWVDEAKAFLKRILGLKIVSKGRKWKALNAEVWRFVLFSEFVFDLPDGPPESLADVPKADKAVMDLIYDLCDRLRDSQQARETYVDHANEVADELRLKTLTNEVEDLGDRDTFAFEERSFLRRFAEAALAGEVGEAGEILRGHSDSIWVTAGGCAQDWGMASRSLDLQKTIEDFRRENATFPSKLEELVDVYLATGRRIDTLHREFHQAWEELDDEPAPEIRKLADKVDAGYVELATDRVMAFTAAVTRENWPPANMPSNREVFEKFVEPALDKRERIAYLLVDSLRYELALGLLANLEDSFECKINAVAAQLPTITPVGMASLMPDAKEKFTLNERKGELVPMIGEEPVVNPADRLKFLKKKLGDRVQMERLDDFLQQGENLKLADTVNLLVLRTTEIDSAGETDPTLALQQIPKSLGKLKRTMRLLGENGFRMAVVATDHGFHLARSAGPGNKVDKPSGEWIMTKDRCLLGKGSSNGATIAMPAADLDIPGDAETYCAPKTLGTFVKGLSYFHAGLSPQECILPVLSVNLSKEDEDEQSSGAIDVKVSYRGGRTDKVTTRRPSLEIQYLAADLFSSPKDLMVALEAKAKGELIGEVGLGEHVDPATQLVRMQAGETIKVTLKIEDDFHGNFEVVALDPETRITYCTLNLKTDILE